MRSGDRGDGRRRGEKLAPLRARVESLTPGESPDIYCPLMAEGPSQRTSRGESGEIATSTLAEIYAQQGLLGRALAIYRRIQARAPEDAEIAERIDRLERRIAESGNEPAPVGAAGAGVEGTTAPPPRERLPWDPPAAVIEPESAEPEPVLSEPVLTEPEPVLPMPEPVLPMPETVLPGTVAPESTPEAAAEESPTRVGPMDSAAFAAWLEGR